MVRLFRWIGFLVTVALRSILGAAGATGGGGGGVPSASSYGITSLDASPGTIGLSSLHDDQVGWEFRADANLTVVSLRVYFPTSSVNQTLRLWDKGTGTLLAEKDVVTTADTWVEVALDSSVSLTSSSLYYVTTRESSGTAEQQYLILSSNVTLNSDITWVDSASEPDDTVPTNDNGPYHFGIVDFGLA